MSEAKETRNKSGDEAAVSVPLSWSDTVSYYLLLFVIKGVSYLPFCVLYALSDIIYVPFYYVVRYRRRVVRKNLTESFPDKSVKEVVRLEKRFYRYFIDTALESCKLLSISGDEMRRRMKFVNPEMIRELLAGGKSISVYLGHYGNWEWVSSAGLWFEGTTIVQVYRKLRGRAANKIMGLLRCRMGHLYVSMHDTARFMAAAARENKQYIYGLIADQSPKRRDAKQFVRFLNHLTPVIVATEKAAKHYGNEAVFIDMKRLSRGYYEGEFILLHGDPQSLPDYELTRLYFRHLEEEILRQPELYLWTHKRFKYSQKVQQQDISPDDGN